VKALQKELGSETSNWYGPQITIRRRE
jgi:hypothetical protein